MTWEQPINARDNQSVRTDLKLAQSISCKATCGRVQSCAEAVYLWCVCGYRRADGDRDGVPCEKVCSQSTKSNLERVRQLKKNFGCR